MAVYAPAEVPGKRAYTSRFGCSRMFQQGARSISTDRGAANGEADMREGWKKAGLIGLGAVLGLLLSLNFSVMADREAKLPIPYEDLQLFSAVFGRIKSDYVEPVADEKLIRYRLDIVALDPSEHRGKQLQVFVGD